MALSADDVSMALFCDFENIALGVRDAQYEKFDIKPVLERLLLKGSIVVKKAYCDWERYKSFKASMHEANFELIEIPHVRQSGKNSADIRMVVDALDLCYTKTHVNTFVIISGDSDFSPLVSKLRENAKRVIGVGVKQSTSDLLIANCDEFIYIDDLMRKRQREDRQNRRPMEPVDPQEAEARRVKGLEMAVSTLEAMLEDRSDDERVWASVLKEAIKRRHPGFNENYHGYRTLGAMLEDAHKRGLLEFGRENNSAFVKRRAPGTLPLPTETAVPVVVAEETAVPPALTLETPTGKESAETATAETAAETTPATEQAVEPVAKPSRRRARDRKPKATKTNEAAPAETTPAIPAASEPPAAEPAITETPAPQAPAKTSAKAAAKPARKPRAARPARPARSKKTPPADA